MEENKLPTEASLLVGALFEKDVRVACAASEKLCAISADSDAVFGYFDEIAPLLLHKNSYMRNRALALIAAMAKWDYAGKTEAILGNYLSCMADEKPITARICIQNLPRIARALPALAPRIRVALESAKPHYRESMQPLIEKDIAAALAEIEERQNGI